MSSTFANILDPDYVGPDLDRNCWHPDGIEKSSIQRVKYGTIIKGEGKIKAILENRKDDQNSLFRKYVIFEPSRVYF